MQNDVYQYPYTINKNVSGWINEWIDRSSIVLQAENHLQY